VEAEGWEREGEGRTRRTLACANSLDSSTAVMSPMANSVGYLSSWNDGLTLTWRLSLSVAGSNSPTKAVLGELPNATKTKSASTVSPLSRWNVREPPSTGPDSLGPSETLALKTTLVPSASTWLLSDLLNLSLHPCWWMKRSCEWTSVTRFLARPCAPL